jgi:hypothetical protein
MDTRRAKSELYRKRSDTYISEIRKGCQTIEGCSDVLLRGLLAIQKQAIAGAAASHVDVRASFVDAVKHLSTLHGPTDSDFVDWDADEQSANGAPACKINNAHTWPAMMADDGSTL